MRKSILLLWVLALFAKVGYAIHDQSMYGGKLLSVEHLGTSKFPGSTNYVEMDRILYVTQVKNQWVAARTLVFSPVSLESKKGHQHFLVFYAHPTVGIACKCSIANNGTNEDKIANVPSLQDFISIGVSVVVPDYYGFVCEQQHPYLVGPVVAMSILDAIRSVRNWKSGSYSNSVCGYGWSQGGHAVLWTQTVAPQYAPELKLLIISAISPPTNLYDLIERNLRSLPGKYLTILGLVSWPNYYPELSTSQLVSRKKLGAVEHISQVCILTPTPEKNLALLPLLTLGKNWLIQNPTQDQRWSSQLYANSPPPQVSPGSQLLVFQGKEDDLVYWNVTQTWAKSVQGPIEFFLYETLNHRTVIPSAMAITIPKMIESFQKVIVQP